MCGIHSMHKHRSVYINGCVFKINMGICELHSCTPLHIARRNLLAYCTIQKPQWCIEPYISVWIEVTVKKKRKPKVYVSYYCTAAYSRKPM